MLCQGNRKKFQGSVLHKLFAKVDNVQSFRQKSAAATKNFLLRKIGLNVFLIKSFPNQSNCYFYLSQMSALIWNEKSKNWIVKDISNQGKLWSET